MIECVSEFSMYEDQIEVHVDKLEIEDNEFLKNVQYHFFCSTA